MNDTKNIKGTVLEIVRMSTEDGPGIRTTVFMKGCSLKCSWCHNPESLSMKPQIQWVSSNCIGCGHCLEVCPAGALTREENQILIDRNSCTGCGTCAETCPAMAMELLGRQWDSEELVTELLKDRAWFEKSGGGVTLSGGEAALQAEFSLRVLRRLREEGIKTALDTCGQIRWEALEKLLPYSDLVLYDLKEIDPVRHKEFTAVSNELILDNLLQIGRFMKDHILPSALWIRTPIIPGATATEKNINGIGDFLKNIFEGSFDRWELCAFNNLCRDKYLRLGTRWKFHDTELLSSKEMEDLAGLARNTGIDPSLVIWTGSTRLEDNDTMQKEKNSTSGSLKRPGTC